MLNNNESLLQVAYCSAFQNVSSFFAEKFPLDKCFKTLVEEKVIDETCRRNIEGAKNINRGREILLEYCKEKNEIKIYDKILDVCYSVYPELANYIIDAINEAKEKCASLPTSYHPLIRNENYMKRDYETVNQGKNKVVAT